MAALNPLTSELVFKIVFYGPGLGGKTTTLQHIHSTSKPEHRGSMVSLSTETERTLYFDFLPLQVLRLRNLTVRLQLFTVPGQVYYGATRKLVLSGCDGVVFVADSQHARLDANQESLDDLNANLLEQGRALSRVPHQFHWNKRDLPDITSVSELDRRLNLFSAPAIETIATTGEGIFHGLEVITRAVFQSYKAELPGGPKSGKPIFLDAEDVGLADAIRDLADSRPRPPSQGTGTIASRPAEGSSPAPPRESEWIAPDELPASADEAPLASRESRDSDESREPSNPAREPSRPAHESSQPPTRAITAIPEIPRARVPSQSPRSPETMSVPQATTLAPATAAAFTLSELWPEEERDAVRRAEAFLGARDAASAVLACDVVLTQTLRRGAAPRRRAARSGGDGDAPRRGRRAVPRVRHGGARRASARGRHDEAGGRVLRGPARRRARHRARARLLVANGAPAPFEERYRAGALLADDVHDDLAPVRRAPVLPHVNPLPRPERERALHDGNRLARTRDRRADVARHVVRSFRVVLVLRRLWREAIHPPREIAKHRGVGVLLNDERRARVPQENRTEPHAHVGRRDDAAHVRAHVVEAAPFRRDRERCLVLLHRIKSGTSRSR
jgi:signal recognition particle receptor subunit beta